jgi:hypothetical protein
MEAIHKELFGSSDFLKVAVQMENGQFIGPIAEKYLYFYYKSSSASKYSILYCNNVVINETSLMGGDLYI